MSYPVRFPVSLPGWSKFTSWAVFGAGEVGVVPLRLFPLTSATPSWISARPRRVISPFSSVPLALLLRMLSTTLMVEPRIVSPIPWDGHLSSSRGNAMEGEQTVKHPGNSPMMRARNISSVRFAMKLEDIPDPISNHWTWFIGPRFTRCTICWITIWVAHDNQSRMWGLMAPAKCSH